MKKFLSLLLTLTLIGILPLSTAAVEPENLSVPISISSGLADDDLKNNAIFNEGDRINKNLITFPSIVYNGNSIASPTTINGIDYTFITENDAFDIFNNDSIILDKKSFTASVEEEIYDKIGFIAFSNGEEAVMPTVTINFADGKSEIHDNDITVNSATTKIDDNNSKSAEEELVKASAGALFIKAVKGTRTLYLNSYEVKIENPAKVKSVEFSQGNYVIFAVTALKYTQEELDKISSKAIDAYWETYKTYTVASNITEEDEANINALYNGLVAAKASNSNPDIATDENITRIGNLKDGYSLYKEKKGYSEYFANAYATKDYRTLSADEITDTDIDAINEIIAKYESAESFYETKEEKYQEILEYFSASDIFDTYTLSDKDILLNLKTTYERNKEEAELIAEIKAIYDKYEGKKASDLQESDIAELEKLIALYEEAQAKGYTNAYNEENYAKIKKLKDYYEKQQTAGKLTYVDLTPYLNTDLMVKEGDTYDANDTLAREIELFNGASIKSDILTVKAPDSGLYADDASQVEVGRTYKLSGAYSGKGNDAVKVAKASTAVTTIKIPETMIKENGMGVILDANVGNNQPATDASGKYTNVGTRAERNVSITVNYSDGTSETASVPLIKSTGYQLPLFYPFAGYTNRMDNTTTSSDPTVKIRPMSGSGMNSPFFYSSNIAFDKEKVVSSLTFNKLSACDYNIVAITIDPITNDEFESLLQAQWDIVKDVDPAGSVPLADTNKMVSYVDECERRGIDPEDYGIDVNKINEFRRMNLTAKSTVYRADRSTVKAEFDFSVPVVQEGIKNKLTITKNSKEFSDYTYNFSDDGKKLTLTFSETQNGGNEYNVTLSGDLRIEEFKEISLGSDSIFSYTVPEYMEISHNGRKFTVKNNSTEQVSGYAGISIFEADKKTVAYSNAVAYTVNGEDSVDVDCDTSAYNGKLAKIMLWDENMDCILNDSTVSSCTSEVVKTADYKEPVLDMKYNSIRLNGITSSKESGKIVSLKIVDENGNVVFAESQKTTTDGYFDFEFIMPQSSNTKTLSFTIGGDDFASPETLSKTVYYYSFNERPAYIEELKQKDKAALEREIPTMKKKLAIDFDPANAISDEKYAEIIFANKDQMLDKDSVFQTQINLKKLAIIAAFSQNNAQVLMSGNELKYDDIMKYSSTIDSDGVTLYSILKTEISDLGITNFQNAVFNKNYANEAELFLAIKQAIFLNAINYPKNGGVGYITKLLTAKNAESAKVTITNYLNNPTYSFNTAIANKVGIFQSLDAVAEFIAGYTASSTDPGNKGNGTSGTAGGFGGSVSGGFSSNVTEEPTYIFNDVTKTHWAYENIMSLYNKGIVSGKGPKAFEPESTITRGELVKMICTSYNLKAVNRGKFVDTEGKWYAEFAQAGYDNGIINGITENEFCGDLPITRQDICTILYRLSKGQTATALTFKDTEEISDYAKDAVAFMVEKGIVNGFTDNTFAPKNNCTRAQAAKIIDMFLQMK